MNTRCWFFGCWSPERIGHHLYPWHGLSESSCPAGEDWTFDCKYAPGWGVTRHGQPLHPSELPQPLGVWRRSVVNGCTVIACWDRSADKRGSSNAAFIVEGERGLKSALTIAKQHFPDQVKRVLTQFIDPLMCERRGEGGAR